MELVKADVKTTFGVGEAHLKQASDKTTSRDVMACENETFADKLLNSIECITEVLGILDRGNIGTYEALTLSKG